jgi:integrase
MVYGRSGLIPIMSIKVRGRPTTYERYKSIITHHLKPHLGHLRLDKLAPEEVQAMFEALRTKSGGRAGFTPRAPAAKTVQNVRIVLRAALNQALKWGKVTRNVATLVDPPRVEKFAIAPLTREQAQCLLDAVRGQRMEALYWLALSLGLRKGEVLALRWADLDFTQRTLRVVGSVQVIGSKIQIVPPKTTSSVRTLPLPDVLLQVILRHRDLQEQEREAYGPDWNRQDLVFPSTNGLPIWPRNVNVAFKRILRAAGLPETTRFHDLRHSCATLLIQQGVHLRVVMEILGHSSMITAFSPSGSHRRGIAA